MTNGRYLSSGFTSSYASPTACRSDLTSPWRFLPTVRRAVPCSSRSARDVGQAVAYGFRTCRKLWNPVLRYRSNEALIFSLPCRCSNRFTASVTTVDDCCSAGTNLLGYKRHHFLGVAHALSAAPDSSGRNSSPVPPFAILVSIVRISWRS